MATLISPGAQVSIVNESFYGDAGISTIPLIVLATAANKAAPSGSGVAPFTVPSMAGKLFLATSQLELTNNYGVPYFKTYQGTMLHGNETNEWGLLAAYNFLGISRRAYILRADIDTAQLEPQPLPPTGPPIAGQYWLNLGATSWGVFQSNGSTSAGLAWTPQNILLPTASDLDDDDVPLDTFGTDGAFCVVSRVNTNYVFQKGTGFQAPWYQVGSTGWKALYPTYVVGSVDLTSATVANNAQIVINGITITLAATDPNATTVSSSEIISAVQAAIGANSALAHLQFSLQGSNRLLVSDTAGNTLVLADAAGFTGTLVSMGLTARTIPGVNFQVTSDAQYPAGTGQGSVWIKGNPSRGGASWNVQYYSGVTATWTTLNAPFFPNDSVATTTLGNPTIGAIYVRYDQTGAQQLRRWNGSAWDFLSYVADADPAGPTTAPAAGSYWFDLNSSFQADIMVGDGTQWFGYNHFYPNTDPAGVLIDGSAPTTQSDGTDLVANDIWLDSSDTENYPMLYRWDATALRWRLIDKTDHTSPFGIIFADARQDSGVSFLVGSVVNHQMTYTSSPHNYNYNSTEPVDLLASDFVDPDAPNPELYPSGMLMFNTRVSTNTMKVWRPAYFQPGSSATAFALDEDYTVNSYTVGNIRYQFPPLASAGRWVNAVGNDASNNLLPFMGRKAQRQMIVTALRAIVTSNQDVRSELVNFNLMACPGYCELIDDMSTLNADQSFVSFIVGDTPMRLTPDANSLLAWANNAGNVAYTGESGLAPGSYSAEAGDYIGLCYPWGLGTDLSGNEVMIPPSAIELVTIAYNDQVAYPWFAPAGFNRGLVTNASSVGYLDSSGAFQPVILNQGQRDILYDVRPRGCQINPIAYIPGRGLVVYGQKTLADTSSAMDRINVARLVNFLRYQLALIVKPFLFEQNDSHTQTAARNVVATFLNSLVGLRALADYAVKCDADNNTPARIDLNELWIDVAIRPLKVVEFIYIPVRILNSSTAPISL